ncbi:MAG: ATP-binding protein [Candidatus Hydrogenedentota bacterium]
MLARLDKHHLLILDELGYVPFPKAGAELLFNVVSRAYERQSLIVTTNLPFKNWTEVFGNERHPLHFSTAVYSPSTPMVRPMPSGHVPLPLV